MAAPPTDSRRKVLEGVLAINKPQWASSAGVLRDLQHHFGRSPLFAPWLEAQRRAMILSGSKKKHIDSLKVKLGHGGTLDPMATGVLIVGVGKGTKQLQRFLECTKTYECVVLFGAATDSYDAVGKVVGTAAYDHVTRHLVESKLDQFRGKILQKPSIFSALKVDGKKMYEYAREGKDIPHVAARPVEVLEMELVEWLEPGSHDFAWPKEEMDGQDKEGAQKLLGIRKEDADASAKRARKRSRSPDDSVENAGEQPKKARTDSEAAMSGALPTPSSATEQEQEQVVPEPTPTQDAPQQQTPTPTPTPPAARLRMTVTSGFYVRSLCHDLGQACSSLALMSSLTRSRQGDYTLGDNVLEYTDLAAGPAVWEPVVEKHLEAFMQSEGWEAEELEDEESWQARKKEAAGLRREEDRERSYRGGGGKWRGGQGKGGRNYYSKDMKGGQRD